MELAERFRELRNVWFNYHLQSNAHEREWESVEKEELRHKRNKISKDKFDRQTEGIIRGEQFTLSPVSLSELDRT